MRTLKKSNKKLITFIITLVLLFSMNAIPASASTVNVEDSIISPYTVIPSWGDHTVSGNPHYSSGFGIRANQSVRLDVNIIYRNGDYPLSVMVYTRDGNTIVASTSFYSSGSHTFNLTEGGSYFIAFNCRAGTSVKFNYTITY